MKVPTPPKVDEPSPPTPKFTHALGGLAYCMIANIVTGIERDKKNTPNLSTSLILKIRGITKIHGKYNR
jgi:hypothetical protein